MELYHVVAIAQNRVIGKDGRLPWHFPEDLKHFKSLTMGGTLIMGRKTFESIGKPLPGRENFVLTKQCHPERSEGSQGFFAPSGLRMTEGVHFFNFIEEALKNVSTEKAFIIGGAEIFKQTFGVINGVYLTRIDGAYEGDVFYPEIPKDFLEKSREKSKENPKLEFIFYERAKGV